MEPWPRPGAPRCPPPRPAGEIHVTIIATGFSQSFEDNLWSGKVAAVSFFRKRGGSVQQALCLRAASSPFIHPCQPTATSSPHSPPPRPAALLCRPPPCGPRPPPPPPPLPARRPPSWAGPGERRKSFDLTLDGWGWGAASALPCLVCAQRQAGWGGPCPPPPHYCCCTTFPSSPCSHRGAAPATAPPRQVCALSVRFCGGCWQLRGAGVLSPGP